MSDTTETTEEAAAETPEAPPTEEASAEAPPENGDAAAPADDDQKLELAELEEETPSEAAAEDAPDPGGDMVDMAAAMDLDEPRDPVKELDDHAEPVTFVNLQYGDISADRAAFKENTGVDMIHDETIEALKDMDGFAAQISAMDLVVSIGNSTVEIAGALGVPVWTLVQFEPKWVWMLERGHSPWYPSMHLYRQSAHGDWESIMDRMAGDLRKMAEPS
ncbi:MAG: hypothetical protein ISR48_02250 [Alphaproteobacteria bacterium]|nr:hypothetical protein [Alphaproteobacteria bacterium]